MKFTTGIITTGIVINGVLAQKHPEENNPHLHSGYEPPERIEMNAVNVYNMATAGIQPIYTTKAQIAGNK